jgi:hypothetical protein
LGGYGTFGRYIAQTLACEQDAQLIIAGRRREQGAAFAESLGAEFRLCNAHEPLSLGNAIADVWLVINASGPFIAKDYSIPQACIASGCHYIDIADGREYVTDIVSLHDAARSKNVFVCAGASTTPAVTSALVSDVQSRVTGIRSIKVALSAGNKNQAGVSTIAAILSYVGRPVKVWQDGAWRILRGWSRGEFVAFPAPVGRRRVQLCDVPDLYLFPRQFGADDVIFKAGVELTVLNRAIGALAVLRRILPFLNLPALARPLVTMSKLFKPFGTLHGGCAAWVTDRNGKEESVALIARKNGPRIPGSPAILLARKLLADQIPQQGAFACLGFLELAEFAEFLAPFDIFVARGEQGVWNSP